jgi:inorganic pyrophosphatase
VDKASGAMFVDRFLHTAMFSGQLRLHPHTLSEDGDPLVLHGDRSDPGGTWCGRARAADRRAAQEDEKGVDEKIIAVPTDKLHPYYKRIGSYCDLPEILVEQIGHFFQHYKDLEKGKWVKVLRWIEPSEAIDLIRRRYRAGQFVTDTGKPGTAGDEPSSKALAQQLGKLTAPVILVTSPPSSSTIAATRRRPSDRAPRSCACSRHSRGFVRMFLNLERESLQVNLLHPSRVPSARAEARLVKSARFPGRVSCRRRRPRPSSAGKRGKAPSRDRWDRPG